MRLIQLTFVCFLSPAELTPWSCVGFGKGTKEERTRECTGCTGETVEETIELAHPLSNRRVTVSSFDTNIQETFRTNSYFRLFLNSYS